MRFPFPPVEVVAAAGPDLSTSEAANCERLAAAEPLPETGTDFHHPASICPTSKDSAAELPFVAGESATEHTEDSTDDSYVAPKLESAPAPAGRARAKRKVIAFPRPSDLHPTYHLSEPVIAEALRILEVPEELEALPTTPLLDGLQFPSHQQQAAAAPADHIELPLQPAEISHRLYAAAVDGALVTAAFGALVGVCYMLLPKLVPSKPVLLTATVLLTSLWAVYQYLFALYRGTTVGMQVASIRLSTFKGQIPSSRQRRSRVFGLYFSTASLMMGLVWALVDVDGLCWHDRISQTYLVPIR